MSNEQRFFISQKQYLIYHTFWFSEDVALFLACLSALETGYGTSDAFRLHCNLFGMSNAVVRPSCGRVLTGKPYADFATEYDSICDFVVWCAWQNFRHKTLHNLDLFLDAMKRTEYNPRVNYYPTIINIYNEYLSSDKELSLKCKPLSY